MDSTIEAINSILIKGFQTAACEMSSGNLAVGYKDGLVNIFSSDGEIKDSLKLEGDIMGILEIGQNLIIGSSISGVCAYSDKITWSHKLNSGCDIISSCGLDILVADSSGCLFSFDCNGNLLWVKELGQVTQLCCNNNGDILAIALENGDLVIMDSQGNKIWNSEASSDDIETISSMIFRPSDVLVVGRNSLGMALDDRPENRIECWCVKKGKIHFMEVNSLVTCLLPTEKGVILGCFNGDLLELEIKSKKTNQLSKFDYSINKIYPWKDDILVASWFDLFRLSPEGNLVWHIEHLGIVENLISMGNSRVAVIGDDKKKNNPTPILVIEPDSEIISGDYNFIEKKMESQFSGKLSAEEEQASLERPNMPPDSAEIFEVLEEELQVQINPPIVEVDILEDLAKSAKSLNISPVVDVGEDRTVSSDSDGTAVVLLDGSQSYDPDGVIKSWCWENDSGKKVSDNSQVRVKLSRGVHVFYLTVIDDRGASSKAGLTVQVL